MNYKKLQIDILKDSYATKRKFQFSGDDNKVKGAIFSGVALYSIPAIYSKLDYPSICNINNLVSYDRLIDYDYRDYKKAWFTNSIIKIDDKFCREIFSSELGIFVYVDNNLFKYFDNTDFEYYDILIKNEKAPVYIVDGESRVIAMFLPVVRKDK